MLTPATFDGARRTGAERTANGWDFWQVKDGGRRVPLNTLRAQAVGSAKRPVARKRGRV